MGHDPQLVQALAVVGEPAANVAEVASEDHIAVQAASISALLDGRYDGDLTVAELLGHGDHGIGTLNGLDGEMIIVDGTAWQATADGQVKPVPGEALTPFAVVTNLADTITFNVVRPAANDDLLALVDDHLPAGVTNAAIRIDGHFERIHARSVPRQSRPYLPLTEVAETMVEWTWTDLHATVVGFRFDSGAAGLEIVGHHLHVLSADRTRGGHVLGCDLLHGRVTVESLDELHVELPPGVDLANPSEFADGDALESIEKE